MWSRSRISMGERKRGATRRAVLIGGLAATIGVEKVRATPEQMRAAIRNVVGAAPVRNGRVELDVPPLVENGNTVSLVVVVDSPMTARDYVKTIHVFNEKNPQPNVISCLLYTSDAADDLTRVDLGGRPIIKKKKKQKSFEI